jgi:NTP pyrophosphatase (non-canonical NTP hydrolase)
MPTITTFKEYQSAALGMRVSLNKLLIQHPDLPEDIIELFSVVYDGLGFGEAGEVQGKIKKIIRDNGGVIDETARIEIAKEIGDTLFYIASLCQNLGISMEDVANMNIEKIQSRHSRGTINGSGDNR